jgi:peptidyl-prolyl cis-trans isomerase SurA
MRIQRPTAWALAAATWLGATAAGATVVERVVAVVGERAILLSDVRERATPALARIAEEVPSGAQRAAATSQLYKALVERMVDEELEQRAASRAKVVVSAQEVDQALARIAGQNHLSVDAVIAEAERAGLGEQQYRNEIRRQVLEAKLLNLRLQGRIRVTETDLQAAYRKLMLDERRKLWFRPAIIVVQAPRALGREKVEARRELAEDIVEQLRKGADFSALARTYSEDPESRARGGALEQVRAGRLPPILDKLALSLEVGEVAEPVRVGDALYVLTILEREESQLPAYAEARGELGERVYLEKMSEARRHWLDGLRRRTHVEIRF